MGVRYILILGLLIVFPKINYSAVTFEQIKNRQIVQFELTDMMLDLSAQKKIDLLATWVELSPKSFRNLNFSKAYLDAADRLIRRNLTNQALILYIKSYQSIDKETSIKVEAAYRASFFLYAQKKRSEALFYINRAIEELIKLKGEHALAKDIFYLKRRIVWRYLSRLEFLPDNAISTIEFDGDDVWIGMWSGAVSRFSRSTSKLDIFNARNTKLPSDYVRDILVQKDKVWVATHNGLAYYNKKDSKWYNVEAMKNYKLKTISHDGISFYVSTLFKGVFRSKDGNIWENIVPSHSVLDILHVGDDLFIATPERGVLVYRGQKVEHFLPNVSAKTIIRDSNPDVLWIGTYGQGLLKINKNSGKILEEYGAKDIRSDYIESLLLIEDKLWVGTLESGVSIYDIKKKKWTSFGLSDGLPGLDITTITRENQHIWFGTLAGGIGVYLFQ